MKVFVFGGGGNIGEHILKELAAKGHEAVTVAETENRAEELKMLGAVDVMVTKEGDFVKAMEGSEAIIYVAGSNPTAGENKNVLVDHEAVIHAIEEAGRQGIERLVYLSPVRADESEESKKTGAKDEPEELIKQEQFVHTIIRPSQAVSKPGKGTVEVAGSVDSDENEIPHEDLAELVVETLTESNSFNKAFEVTSGDTPIKEALHDL